MLLTQADVAMAIRIGKAREEANRAAGVRDRRYSVWRHPTDISIQGVIGEIAARKFLGLPLDPLEDCTPRSKAQGTDTGDLVFRGWRVDVKSHFVLKNGIRVSKRHCQSSPVYCLLHLRRNLRPSDPIVDDNEEFQADLVGWVTADDLEKRGDPERYPGFWYLSAEDLRTDFPLDDRTPIEAGRTPEKR